MNKDMLFRRIYALKKMEGIILNNIAEILDCYNVAEKDFHLYCGSTFGRIAPKGASKAHREELQLLQNDLQYVHYAHHYLYWDILPDNRLEDEYDEYFKSEKSETIYKKYKDYRLTNTWVADCLEEKESA